ncbi:hypothetical protein PC116_g25636, partial [Phytophthora cactorum]
LPQKRLEVASTFLNRVASLSHRVHILLRDPGPRCSLFAAG